VQVQGQLSQGSAWIVPERWYSPIRQDAILLKQGKDHEAARALWVYLRSDSAKAVIRSFGYTF
jgi:molybdate transport system substrate-binding protein